MTSVRPHRARQDIRQTVLAVAFKEFYQHGFQGGSLNRIVDDAGTTKGGLFHHFASKLELGYAVVDEFIAPLLKTRWLDPIADSIDPIGDLKKVFRKFIREDIASGSITYGCPLNNLAQEMSPLDEGFRIRLNGLYALWRDSIAAALTRGIKSGAVRKEISPRDTASVIVAMQMGIWGSGKSSQDPDVMLQAGEGLCLFLDMLKTTT